MSESESWGVVIVGAGQAGAQCADSLRQAGYAGAISLIGDEPLPPYRRPPLSKSFLAGDAGAEALVLKPQAAFEKQSVQCRFGVRAESMDRAARTLKLSDGSTLAYGHLVLATGGRARKLSLPGSDLPQVHTLRTEADARALGAAFAPGNRLVIVGGGYVGLEVAATATKKGVKATVLEAQPRVLARVTAPELSAFYEAVHRKRGVTVRTGVGLAGFEPGAVRLNDGERIGADAILVGVGLAPGTELAEAAGLEVNNGIVVNAQLRTADPHVWAIGDCANYENGFLNRRVRLESVPNAIESARVCAAAIAGKPAPAFTAPWFWSDQYDLKLQMVGLSQGYDRLVLRGDPVKESFCAYYLKDGVLIAADAVNRSAEFVLARKWVGERTRLSAEVLADEAVDLKTLKIG